MPSSCLDAVAATVDPAPVTPLAAFALMLAAAESTPSKTEKTAIVKRAVDGPFGADVKRLLIYALSPFQRFYLQQLPEAVSRNAWSGDMAIVYKVLDNLASRRVSGGDAKAAVQMLLALLPDGASAAAPVSPRAAFQRVLLKDLRAGFDASTANKAAPGLIPTFPYMRCSLVKDVKLADWPWAQGVTSQEKADGMFANLDVTPDGAVTLSSRQGTAFPMGPFEALAAEAAVRLDRGTQNHGELLVERDGAILPREIGNGILNKVAQGGAFGPGERPLYLIWDQIPLAAVTAKGKHEIGYAKRLGGIEHQLTVRAVDGAPLIRVIETRFVSSYDEALAHYRALLAQGKEGTILKHPDAIWRDGTSKHQVKLKLEVAVDLEITGFTPGSGKNAATFGSVTCKTACGRLVVDVSGFTDARRAELNADRAAQIGRIMTVLANAIMPPSESNPLYSLFLPRHVEIRTDKSVADDLERVQAQFASAVQG